MERCRRQRLPLISEACADVTPPLAARRPDREIGPFLFSGLSYHEMFAASVNATLSFSSNLARFRLHAVLQLTCRLEPDRVQLRSLLLDQKIRSISEKQAPQPQFLLR